MSDFRIHRRMGGVVELVPLTSKARIFVEPFRLDGVEVEQYLLTASEWPPFQAALDRVGLVLEEAAS